MINETSSRPVFDEGTLTDAKRLVRGDLYLHLRNLLGHGKNRGRILILPGRTTEELSVARTALPRARIVAVDDDPVAAGVANASCLADEVFCKHVEDYTARVTFANLDFCGHVKPRELGGVSGVTRVARRASLGMSVFMSYGRDLKAESAHFAERVARDMAVFSSSLPPIIFGRVVTMFDEVRLGMGHPASLVRVYRYRGRKIPMVGIVVLRGAHAPWAPLLLEARDHDLLGHVEREISLNAGTDPRLIEDIFCVRGRVAALRAVRTMKRRGKLP